MSLFEVLVSFWSFVTFLHIQTAFINGSAHFYLIIRYFSFEIVLPQFESNILIILLYYKTNGINRLVRCLIITRLLRCAQIISTSVNIFGTLSRNYLNHCGIFTFRGNYFVLWKLQRLIGIAFKLERITVKKEIPFYWFPPLDTVPCRYKIFRSETKIRILWTWFLRNFKTVKFKST